MPPLPPAAADTPGAPSAAPASSATGSAATAAAPRVKLVRDSFTMPRADHELIAILKAKAAGHQRPARKSELLRAGLHALLALPAPQLLAALDALAPVPADRPKKGR